MAVCEQCGTVGEGRHRLEDAEHRVRILELRLAGAEYRADELQAALIASQARLEDIIGSRFWRFTAPVRRTTRRVRHFLRPLKLGAMRAWSEVRVLWETRSHPPALPVARPVLVSIVISTRNDCLATLACLKSIQEQTRGLAYEVIVVDDASSDLTPLIFGGIEGLVYVRNWRRRGLSGSYTRGASRAQGKFLVFLRDDSLVTGRWLDELLETFALFPGTGLVGSKVVCAEGRVATICGPLERPDGRAEGRLDEMDDPRDDFVREVEDCSSACVMVPAELFRSLGDVPTRSDPVHGGEISLALPVRQQGHRVIYQPLSRVIQRTGLLSEEMRTRRDEVRRVVNLSRVRARGLPSRKILVIDDIVPAHDKDAGSLRMSRLLGLLKRRSCHVTFIPFNLAFNDPYTRDLQRIGVEVLYRPHVDTIENFLKAHGKDYSLIWICRPYAASLLLDAARTFAPAARLVFDTIDLHFLRVGREAALRGDPAMREYAEQLKQQELDIARKVDFTIVVSEDERERVLEEAGPIDIRVVSTIHAVQPLSNRFEDRSGLLFIGGFNHTPNVDAVQFFVSSIFPELRRTIPGVKFYVVGSNPTDAIRSLASEDIVVTGYVPDASEYFRNCRLSVAPLRIGAGVKGKVNMSLAYGLPAVVTSIAAEGMHLVDGENALIADDPPAFIAAVQRLHHSEALWAKLSANGMKNVEEHFSFEVASRELDRLLDDVGFDRPHRPVTSLQPREFGDGTSSNQRRPSLIRG